MPIQDRTVSLHPYFRVSDGKMEEFRALCEQFVSKAAQETDCLYYGFSMNGNEVFCREGYKGAEGLLAHLTNVGPLVQESLKISELIRLEVHGSEEELAKLREPLADLNPAFFTLEYSLAR